MRPWRSAVSVGCVAVMLLVGVTTQAAPKTPAPPPPKQPPPAASSTATSSKNDSKKPATTKQKHGKKGKNGAAIPETIYHGFEMTPEGGSRFFVEIDGTTKVVENKGKGTLSYVLTGVRVDVPNNRHWLELMYHNTPMLRARLRQIKDDTELQIELRTDATATVKTTDLSYGGQRIEIEFAPGKYVRDEDPLLDSSGRPTGAKQSTSLSGRTEASGATNSGTGKPSSGGKGPSQ